MKLFSRFFFLLNLVLAASVAQAATLTITDNQEPHGAITRFEQFATTLSATVYNPPLPTSETTITGPTWHWSTPPSSAVHPTSSSGQNSGLTSGFPPNYGGEDGIYPVDVTCTATYTRTNINNPAIQFSIPVSNTKTITFFIRTPEVVIQTAARNHTAYNGQLYPFPDPANPNVTIMRPAYGHIDTYALQIKDNQDINPGVDQRLPYGNGLPREELDVTQGNTAPNGARGPSTWGFNTDGTGSPTDNFTDAIGYLVTPSPGNQDLNAIISVFNQPWYCMELIPPYAPPRNLYLPPNAFDPDTLNPTEDDFLTNVEGSILNTHHVANRFGYAVRSYPGSPWPN